EALLAVVGAVEADVSRDEEIRVDEVVLRATVAAKRVAQSDLELLVVVNLDLRRDGRFAVGTSFHGQALGTASQQVTTSPCRVAPTSPPRTRTARESSSTRACPRMQPKRRCMVRSPISARTSISLPLHCSSSASSNARSASCTRPFA